MTSDATVGQKVVLGECQDEFLRTDHLRKNLRQRSINGTFVTVIAQGAKFVLTLVSTVILARLLSPKEFGLVAIVTTVTSVLRIFKDAGLSTATVQREGITHAQVSNLFWINALLSGLIGLIVAALAPVIAWFFHDSRLTAITLFLSTTYLMSGLTVQHRALLNRQMRFKALAFIEIGSMTASLVVGVAMALWGSGYWSLVGSSITLEAVGLLLTWGASRWRPQLPTRRSGTRSLLGFGANLTAGHFIFSLARGMDTILIGRAYGPESVGLYSRAMALLMRPLEQFLSPISAVFVPVLSRLQSQPERYRRTFLQLNDAIALIGFFFTGLVFALAYPITLVLLGSKWESAAVIFGGFTFAALYVPLSIAGTWLFTSQGRGRDVLIANSILSAVNITAFIAGLPFGPLGVAIAFSVSGCLIRLPILYYMCGKRGPVTTADLWKGLLRQLSVWFIVFGCTWLTHTFVSHLLPINQLLICVPVGLLTGSIFIAVSPVQRRVAVTLFQAIGIFGKSK